MHSGKFCKLTINSNCVAVKQTFFIFFIDIYINYANIINEQGS